VKRQSPAEAGSASMRADNVLLFNVFCFGIPMSGAQVSLILLLASVIHRIHDHANDSPSDLNIEFM